MVDYPVVLYWFILIKSFIEWKFSTFWGSTIYLSTYNSSNFKFQIQPGYDYELFIPGKNRLLRISDITEMVIEERHCDISDGYSPCKNPISSYKIDGQINSKNYIFIRNWFLFLIHLINNAPNIAFPKYGLNVESIDQRDWVG